MVLVLLFFALIAVKLVLDPRALTAVPCVVLA